MLLGGKRAGVNGRTNYAELEDSEDDGEAMLDLVSTVFDSSLNRSSGPVPSLVTITRSSYQSSPHYDLFTQIDSDFQRKIYQRLMRVQ